jgi:A/G-specific adenine glycosylase
VQSVADALVPHGNVWEWNQALMDLGATVCTARSPQCRCCPLARGCVWREGALPDPAPRPARQSRFEGSDRQGRGRLIAALRHGPVHPDQLPSACGWPEDPGRAGRVAEGLVAEGLVRRKPNCVLVLP